MNSDQIMEGLKKLFAPKATGAQWLNYQPQQPAPPGPPPWQTILGVQDELEILEISEETWLGTHAPHLIRQRRLGAKHSFACQATYTNPQRIELGLVLFADGNAKNLCGERAILELRAHVGREVWVIQKRADGLNHDFIPGSEQKRICARHGLAWLELNEPIDTEHRSYPAVLF